MNGFGAQGGPRNGPNPVTYPFKNFDGTVTVGKQRSGQRVYDINVDGVAHYGLYPDWVEDLRKQAGDEIIRDLARGPEAYLQMWERAEGIPTGCRPPAPASPAAASPAPGWAPATPRCCGARASRSAAAPGRGATACRAVAARDGWPWRSRAAAASRSWGARARATRRAGSAPA